MPITINGNGTITGVSVGGLPDGIVDTDMLAANAVATSKLANDSVSAAKLASGAGGKILQVITAQKLNPASTSSTTMVEISSDLRCTITPTSASSKIIILCSLYLTMSATAHISSVEIRKDGTLINAPANYNTGTHDGHTMNYTNSNWMGNNIIQTIETAGNTNSRTYSPYYKGTGADVYLNAWGTSDYRGISSITVMEVAA